MKMIKIHIWGDIYIGITCVPSFIEIGKGSVTFYGIGLLAPSRAIETPEFVYRSYLWTQQEEFQHSQRLRCRVIILFSLPPVFLSVLSRQ